MYFSKNLNMDNQIELDNELLNAKLILDDEEIQIVVSAFDGAVIINFGKPLYWLGLEKKQAIEIANTMIKIANSLP